MATENLVNLLHPGIGNGKSPSSMLTLWLFGITFIVSMFSQTASQNIFVPPQITQPDRANTMYFKVPKPLNLTCKADGLPKPVYEWRRNGERISINRNVTFDENSGTLRFIRTWKEAQGSYKCRAWNKINGRNIVSVSDPQTLIAVDVGKFIKIAPKTLTATSYEYKSLECSGHGNAVGPKDKITYQWYYSGSSDQIKTDKGRIFISNDGTLHFTYTKTEDQLKSSDMYKCAVTSAELNIMEWGNSKILEVRESSPPQPTRPSLKYSYQPAQAILGTSAKLECVFSGYNVGGTLPEVKWFNDAGQEIKENTKYKLLDRKRILRVTDVQENDDTHYSCQGVTRGGSSPKHSLYLNVTSSPIWVEAPRSQTVIEGASVTIKCIARSAMKEKSPDMPVWYINGKQYLQNSRSNIDLSNDQKTMTIRDVSKPGDILCTQCVVKNSVGEISGGACVNVLMPIKMEVSCDKCHNKSPTTCSCTTWGISQGNSIQVKFTTTTDPAYEGKLSREWTADGQTYRFPDLPAHWTHDAMNGDYFLKTGDLSKEEISKLEGKYVFKVYHSYDSQNITLDVMMEGPTPEPSTASAGMDMWIIGLIIGLVFLLIIVVIIVVTVVCRRQQEGAYNVDRKETKAGLDPETELKRKAFSDLSGPESDDLLSPQERDTLQFSDDSVRYAEC